MLLEGIKEEAKSYFEERGYKVELVKGTLAKEELKEKIKDVEVLGIRSKTEIDEEVLAAAKNLKVIGGYVIGLNKVNLPACTNAGVTVFNAPHSSTRSVAELAIGLIISLFRKLGDRNREMHAGEWKKSAKGSFEVRGKTLGIVGYGNIGVQVSVLAEAFGMKVVFFDPYDKLPMGNAEKMGTLEELLGAADIVALHAPSPNLMNKEKIGLMKKGSYLINLSRGNVVDLTVLALYLKSGHLAGAAIDVYTSEPKTNDEKFVCELQDLPNVILTPHIGASTEEAQMDIALSTSEKVYRFLTEGRTIGSVNPPKA